MAALRDRWRLIATAVFVALLLSPAVRPGDGVPLSSYPMYASPRSAVVEFVVAQGIAPDGEVVALTITHEAPDVAIAVFHQSALLLVFHYVSLVDRLYRPQPHGNRGELPVIGH